MIKTGRKNTLIDKQTFTDVQIGLKKYEQRRQSEFIKSDKQIKNMVDSQFFKLQSPLLNHQVLFFFCLDEFIKAKPKKFGLPTLQIKTGDIINKYSLNNEKNIFSVTGEFLILIQEK